MGPFGPLLIVVLGPPGPTTRAPQGPYANNCYQLSGPLRAPMHWAPRAHTYKIRAQRALHTRIIKIGPLGPLLLEIVLLRVTKLLFQGPQGPLLTKILIIRAQRALHTNNTSILVIWVLTGPLGPVLQRISLNRGPQAPYTTKYGPKGPIITNIQC